MTTVATDQLVETIQDLKNAAMDALTAETPDAFSDLEKFVSEVEAYTREVQQTMWGDKARSVIGNLGTDAPLTPGDKETIRTFLISDAEFYLKHENDYGNWKRELTRLMDDLCRRANTIDETAIGDLRGVLKDAQRLVPDLRNYTEEQERVEKFNNALNSLDRSARDMLARLLTEQLRSTDR